MQVLALADHQGVEFSAWDYAGNMEYYVTHEIFLADENAVLAVVCSLANKEGERERQARYWLTCIKTRFAGSRADGRAVLPQVVLIGSNVDADDAKEAISWGE